MPAEPDDFDLAVDELIEDSNDRAVGIVAATLLEVQLQEAIVSRLLPMSKGHQDALFQSDDGYTFSSKIDLGMSLGLYGNQTRLDLHRIKKVRNEFAHNINRSFGHPRILGQITQLTDHRIGEPLTEEVLEKMPGLRSYMEERETRWRYLFAVMAINLGLVKETVEPVTPPKPRFLP